MASSTARLGRSKRLRPEDVEGYLLVLPWLLGFVIFQAGPLLFSLGLIGFKWEIVTPAVWVGLGNLRTLVSDPLMATTLYNTVYFVVLSVPLTIGLALLVALALNVALRGVNLYRVVYYLPSQVPVVANALLWLWIFNPQYGLANAVLAFFGLPQSEWLFDPTLAKPALVLMGLWGIGQGMVIFIAGLQGIPTTLYEAAEVDGAVGWSRFWGITVPLLTPVIFFQVIIGIIGTFQAGFAYVYIMTNGGPDNATLLYILYLYRQAFENFHMGYAAAMAWLLFLIVGGFTLIQFRMAKNWVYYESVHD